jgi:ABC-type long-subunit fatty acid transport system fused permease/ATPase subunit
MLFDATVNLGQLITIVPILVGGAIVFGSLRQILKDQGVRIESLEEESKKQTEILIKIATQDQRLADLERRMESQEHPRRT